MRSRRRANGSRYVARGSAAGGDKGVALPLAERDAHLACPVEEPKAFQVTRPLLAFRVRLTGPAAPIDANVAFAPPPGRTDAEIFRRRLGGTRHARLAIVVDGISPNLLADPAITEQGLALCVFCARVAFATPRRLRRAHSLLPACRVGIVNAGDAGLGEPALRGVGGTLCAAAACPQKNEPTDKAQGPDGSRAHKAELSRVGSANLDHRCRDAPASMAYGLFAIRRAREARRRVCARPSHVEE
jgi:hypothetical protein